MRATAQDRQMAMLVGVNVNKVISFTFIIGSGLAAVGGVLIASHIGQINFYIGFIAGIKAFTAAVLGGIGSASPERWWAPWSWDGPRVSPPATFRATTRMSSPSPASGFHPDLPAGRHPGQIHDSKSIDEKVIMAVTNFKKDGVLKEIKKSLLVAVWFMFLTFPIMVIKVNTIEKTINWRWWNMVFIGVGTFFLSLIWRKMLSQAGSGTQEGRTGRGREKDRWFSDLLWRSNPGAGHRWPSPLLSPCCSRSSFPPTRSTS